MSIGNLYQTAKAALGLRKYDFAMAQAREILAREPHASYAYGVLAEAYYCLGKLIRAEACIKKALKGDPTNVGYLCWYCAILNAEQKYEEALSVSDEALTIEPTDTTVMYYRGFALYNLGKQERAENVTKYLLEKEPNDEHNHRLLADIYVEKNQLGDANLEYQKALEINPNNSTTYNNYALMKLEKETNKENEAIEMLKESLRLDPECQATQRNLKYAIDCRNKKLSKFLVSAICWTGILLVVCVIVWLFIWKPEITLRILLYGFIYWAASNDKEFKKGPQFDECILERMRRKYKPIAVLFDLIFWLIVIIAVLVVLFSIVCMFVS